MSLRIALVLGGMAVLAVLAVGVFLVLLAVKNRPPKVPGDFAAPSALAPAAGAAPSGSLFYDSDRTGNFEVYVAPSPGATPTALTHDPTWDSWWPRLSPDRHRVLFYRTPKGVHDTNFSKTHLWMMNADGTGPVELRPPGLDGWAQQGHADWSPDGQQLVMFGGKNTNPQIYVTQATGQSPRRLTDRGGINVDPSFSPDGRTIAFVGCPQSVCFEDDYEIYTMAADGASPAQRLTDDRLRDHDPYYSPDGTRIAWLTRTSTHGQHPGGSWNIRIANADGSDQRRLTDDDQINSKPEWSRDGQTIYFHRFEMGRLTGFSIFSIDIAGSHMVEVTAGQPGVNEFPST
jgi:Tol biopolymer transport system component